MISSFLLSTVVDSDVVKIHSFLSTQVQKPSKYEIYACIALCLNRDAHKMHVGGLWFK